MINSCTLVGRITKDPELRKTESNKSVLSFTLACGDKYNKEHTDFINCVAWNQSADYLSKYAVKGNIIGLTGRIATRTFDGKNGKVYVTEVVCDNVTILSSKEKGDIGGVAKEELHNSTIVPTTEDDVYVDEYEEQKATNVNLDISSDDLPFY